MPGKDRQRQLAREKLQRQMVKRAEAARRRRRAQATTGAALAVVAVIGLAALGVAKLNSGHKPGAKTTTCGYQKPPGQSGDVPRKAALPPGKGVAKAGTARVRLDTGQGSLTLTLDRAKAPCTVNSFLSLARQKYFDNVPCHRLTTSQIFVLQCGDPGGTGAGGPGYRFGDEGLPANTDRQVTYPTGTLAMANAGPGTNGSQFFIVYQDTRFQPKYTRFGTISAGLDIVLKIAKAGAIDPTGKPAGDGKPSKPVVIEHAEVLG